MDTPTRSDLRILQVGNVFLDRPIERLREGVPERRREELRDVFSHVLQMADESEVSLVLFTGNLFDSSYLTNETVEFLVRELSLRPHMQFVIAPGPSDPYGEKSIYRSGRFPRNVHIISEEVLSELDLPSLGVTVYGWAFTSESHRFSPIKNKHVRDPERLNVLAGFCECDKEDSERCPVSSDEIAAFGAHYAALSDTGVFEGFMRVGNCVMASSGKMECTSFADKQVGGVNLISAKPHEEGAWQIFTKRLPAGAYRYAEVVLDVSHVSSEEVAAERLLSLVRKEGYDGNTALRVYLRGAVAPETSFYTLVSREDFGVYALEVVDETVPTDGTEYLAREMSARGELYRRLLPAMTEGTPESRARAARLFRIGYAALLGKDPLKL